MYYCKNCKRTIDSPEKVGDKCVFCLEESNNPDLTRLDYLIKYYAALAAHPRSGIIADAESKVRKEIERCLGF